MRKAKVTIRNSYSTSPNARRILFVIVSAAVFCVLIVGIVYAKSNGAVTLLSAIVTEINNSADNSEQSVRWETVQMRVTAYCPCAKCCGKYSDGVTACNHKIRRGDVFVAADGKFPFGSEMIIPGYNGGEAVKVLDRGGAIRGDRLDVFFHAHKEALEWGVKYLDVKVRI